jgi:Fe-S oxidoreductase
MSLEEYRQDIWDCVRCSNCKYVQPWSMKSQRFSKICPSNARYLFDAYSCQGKIDIARAIMEGELDYRDSLELVDIIYKCTLCGACDIMCKFFMDMEPLLIFEELRAKLIEDGKALPAYKAIIDSVKSYNNVWMQPRTKRGTWAKGLDVKDISKEKAEVLYYVGCTYAYNVEFQRVARETVAILKKAGVNLGILGNKEVCCGSPIIRIGDREDFKKLAKDNLETFNNLGINKVITSCAGCYSTFKVDYPKIGKMNFRVLHAAEYIDQLIKEGKLELTKEVPLAVTYHDPCHLGRRSEPYIPWEGRRVKYGRYEPPKELRRGTYGIYQPPRDILKSIPGLELIEMERIKEYAWCCGSGGGVKSAFPDFALWSAQERIEEAISTGAESLVTSCPWCEANFMDAIKAGGSEIGLYSLVDLVCRALGEDVIK